MIKILSLYFACLMFSMSIAKAEELSIAVASNFSTPITKIAQLFEKKTGHKVQISLGSTAKFFTQISHGAPFDLFLAADQEHPQKLAQNNLAMAREQFTYAIGRLALWSSRPHFVDEKGRILQSNNFKHLALANPDLAPYGKSAKEILNQMNIWEKVKDKIVLGENIAQAYQFVSSGNAELGFIALSQWDHSGSLWIVPENLYSPLKQDAILLKRAENKIAAKDFLNFLKSNEVKKLIEEHGYKNVDGQ